MAKAHTELIKTDYRKLFLKYLIPSLFGMLLIAINILIDGLFVSNGVGERALAGVNVAVPVYTVILSLSLWIGMGGGTLYSITLGNNDTKHAREVFSQSIVIALVTTGFIITLAFIFKYQMAYFFGANEQIIKYVIEYLHVILLFGIIFVFENIFSIFVRNDGAPTLAMIALVITSIVNIILNYIFIFKLGYGVTGAAYATVIGAVVGVLILFTHFINQSSILKFVKPNFSILVVKDIFSIGFPSFVVEIATGGMIILFNITFGFFTGSIGLASFAIINYLHTVFIMLFIGIGAAVQPLTSFHFGARLYDRMKQFVNLGLITGGLLGVIIYVSGLIGSNTILDLFGVENENIRKYTKTGILIFFIGYPFLAINMVMIEYYQSIRETKMALMIVFLRSFIIFIPLLIILPRLFGDIGIWFVFPIAEVVTVILTFLFIKLSFVDYVPHRY